MEKIAIYPGTFDPITLGHIDVINRASKIFDRIIVSIAINQKKQTLFSLEERLELATEALKDYTNIEVKLVRGLIVDFAIEMKATALIRGLRAVSDFEYEFQIALMNKKIANKIDTVFLMPDEKYTYLNSSIIRELSSYGKDVSDFVPTIVSIKLKEKFLKGNDNKRST